MTGLATLKLARLLVITGMIRSSKHVRIDFYGMLLLFSAYRYNLILARECPTLAMQILNYLFTIDYDTIYKIRLRRNPILSGNCKRNFVFSSLIVVKDFLLKSIPQEVSHSEIWHTVLVIDDLRLKQFALDIEFEILVHYTSIQLFSFF